MFVHKMSGISESWEALFSSNLSMFFFMSSILQNVSFSQLHCIASMFDRSLYKNIALRVGSVMFSVTESNSQYLEIFRL